MCFLNVNVNTCFPLPTQLLTVKAQNTVIDKKNTLPLREGKYVEVILEDHGVGISSEHLSRVFEPYFTTKQKGSGLGLATAYSIIKNHDGYITVNSELGVGTTFSIYLPASEKRLPVEKEAIAEVPITGTGRILVMDDEDVIRQFLLQELTEVGYDVALSSDGAEAIDLYKQAREAGQPFDAVVLDLTVPGAMGGKQTIKKLLEIDPEVKAIVSSGYSTTDIIADAQEYGFKGVVAKPYKMADLENVLQSVLKK